MNTYLTPIIELTLNDQVRIKIICKKKENFQLDELVIVKLDDNTHSYNLSYLWLENSLKIFQTSLREVLDNKRPLTNPLKEDIGFVFNQLLHDEFHPTPIDLDWPTDNFSLWEWHREQPNLKTWLYNDAHGSIILHITEIYFWYGRDRNEGNNYISYKEFMKSYKPTFVASIPHSVAREWLTQCEFIYSRIRNNEKFLHNG